MGTSSSKNKNRKLIDDPRLTKELYSALLHYLLEDDSAKRHRKDSKLIIKAEFQDWGEGKEKQIFQIEGEIGNTDYLCTSLRFYEMPKEGEKAVEQILQSDQESE